MTIPPQIGVSLPFLGSAFGIMTILIVYQLALSNNHIPPGALTPPISLLGCNAPEHLLYQLGFSTTGILLWISLHWYWQAQFYPRIQKFGQGTAETARVGGYLAVLGLMGQGIITLEDDFLHKLHMQQGFSAQSKWHQHLAGVFFLGAALHCYSTIYYCLLSARRLQRLQESPIETEDDDHSFVDVSEMDDGNYECCCYGPWSVRLKLVCVILSLLAWPIAEGLHPARTASMNKRNLNVAGLAQYVAVASYIIFFGSYSIDLRAEQPSLKNRPETSRLKKED